MGDPAGHVGPAPELRGLYGLVPPLVQLLLHGPEGGPEEGELLDSSGFGGARRREGLSFPDQLRPPDQVLDWTGKPPGELASDPIRQAPDEDGQTQGQEGKEREDPVGDHLEDLG